MVQGVPAGTRKTVRSFRAYIGLLEASDRLPARMAGQLELFELTTAEFRLLEVLLRRGPLYREQIAESFGYTPQAIGLVVERLRKRGLVEREVTYLEPAPTRASKTRKARRGFARKGQRIAMLSLTTLGKRLIGSVLPKHAKLVKAMMRPLDGREQETLARLCKKLREGDALKFYQEMTHEEEW